MATRKFKQTESETFYDILANPVTSLSLTENQYSEMVREFLIYETPSKFNKHLKFLGTKTRFLRVFNSTARTLDEIAVKPTIQKGILPERLAEIYKLILSASSHEIVEFYRCRRQYEQAMLRGQYDLAGQAIAQCKEKVGESFWYVRATFALLVKKGNFDELERFSNECKERSSNQFFTLLLNYSLLLASNPALHFKRTVARTINELDEASLTDWAGLLHLLFSPRPLTPAPEELKGFLTIQIFPAVDQAYLLEDFVTEAIATYGSDGDPFHFQKIFTSLKSVAFGDTLKKSSEILNRLTVFFEEDRFEELTTELVKEFDNIETPFAALNLMSKSIASAPGRVSPFPLGAWGVLSNTLVQIYRLESPPNKLEEDFLSLAIRFHDFSGAKHLQLAVFMALPYRYLRKDATWLARAAQATSPGTPLARELAKGEDPILSHEYLKETNNLPSYREIKQRIRKLWINENTEEIKFLLLEYRDLVPLKKDYVELSASFYLRTNRFDELLEFSANVLSENPQMYVALPISEIVSYAENLQLSSLAALIVFYTYVRHVETQKEYLLNEAYEEYLLSNHVTRPTELLEKIRNISSLETMLFRNISSVDTMDYLGCFNNSNELRSERVKILDSLNEKQAISAEAYREEIDEIVGQVVVDAGAAKFNINKIDVNVSAIKRYLHPDISSMLQLYQALGDDAQLPEKAIKVEVDANAIDGEKLRIVVAGDRHTTLLRMLLLVRDQFLYDEKHGLDKNLSTEIRHGFFANLMRSRLEEHKLITEIDDSGKYKKNLHWRDVNVIAVDEILDEIDDHLAWFSDAFNRLVSQAEEWMKIRSLPNDERVFNFDLHMTDLERFHPFAKKYEAEDFIDLCFAKLWNEVDVCLAEMREKLNVSFKDKVNRLFDDLLFKIQTSKKNLPMVDLIGSIINVKNDIREDITVVSEWFKRSESGAATSRTVEALIKISIECFYQVRGAQLNLNVNLAPDFFKISVAGHHTKTFIVALVNLLENACRGSGFGLGTQIEVNGVISPASWSLSVRNPISSERFPIYTKEFLVDLDHRMRSPSSVPLMRREGGTGLTKVFNQLRLIDEHFDVKLTAAQEIFEVRINYVM